jgi:hypothetical protein
MNDLKRREAHEEFLLEKRRRALGKKVLVLDLAGRVRIASGVSELLEAGREDDRA